MTKEYFKVIIHADLEEVFVKGIVRIVLLIATKLFWFVTRYSWKIENTGEIEGGNHTFKIELLIKGEYAGDVIVKTPGDKKPTVFAGRVFLPKGSRVRCDKTEKWFKTRGLIQHNGEIIA